MYNIRKFFLLTYNRLRYPELVERHKTEFDRGMVLNLFKQLTHPLRTFGKIKYENGGSLIVANILLVLYFFTQVFVYFRTGYLFTNNEPSDFSFFQTLVSSAGILFLWAVCNWTTGTLLEGEAAFRELWISSCYSVVPYVIIQFIVTSLSPMLVLAEATMLNTFSALSQIWMLALLFLGMMIMQQFSVSRALASAALTVLMMLAVVFLILLFFSIFQQMTGFVSTVVSELGH